MAIEVRRPRDERDGEALHLVAVDDAVIGTCRMLIEPAVRVGMHAQTGALQLYERAGDTPDGERFDEEGIEHIGMEKRL